MIREEATGSEEPTARERSGRTDSGSASLAGMLWFAGWLFSIGFADLVWWQGLLALVLWPYYIGAAVG